MKLFKYFLIFILLMAAFGGRELYLKDEANGKIRDIQNFTESTLKWNSSNFQPERYNETSNLKVSRITNILNKAVDFFGFSTFEITKFSLEYGYENPKWDYKTIMDLVIGIIYLIIIATLVPVVPYIIALIYLIGYGIYYLIKKWRNKNTISPQYK